ncbi:hypothetical protein KBZ18_10130 [Synechococcus sp. Cruz-9H2]|uniref:hypothetical protein n=1 Tax=unclassified Synechococcus TaxID=2626047 RepID=UPI0020CC0CF6|nr:MULTISPECIES: hypothetical protein [unclassified Synechococcus]MCP9819850.1 hypothetical protein [Synechococcus sp. Cruz-9H2]MCP9844084.1 hypothetical protein [Synechococcus sp. Edmonson 11F2]MCP9856280.1 hypothetical protein [Synechococcus sp. Cruz-9C9]MCP9863565.1 hypothetical protein [Synechococcus sp. Cruz-7E5]MCP9870761.1 hypothetical protein [Synechococcus sp. Cruz-7B9]
MSTTWRASDLEAIRSALLIPVTAPALRAINDAMAGLERSYPDAIPAATDHLDAINAIDLQLGQITATDLSRIRKVRRKGAAGGEPPAALPVKKLDVIEYDTNLLIEEIETEYADAPSEPDVLRAQRRARAASLLLILPSLCSWIPERPSPFTGTMLRG